MGFVVAQYVKVSQRSLSLSSVLWYIRQRPLSCKSIIAMGELRIPDTINKPQPSFANGYMGIYLREQDPV